MSLEQSHAILSHIISKFSHVTFLRNKLVSPKLPNIGTILEATVQFAKDNSMDLEKLDTIDNDMLHSGL